MGNIDFPILKPQFLLSCLRQEVLQLEVYSMSTDGDKASQEHSRWINPAAQKRSQKTLERILEAARQLLAIKPFREISITDITAAARSSPPSFYARFENKQALLGALYDQHAVSQRKFYKSLFEPATWTGTPLEELLKKVFHEIVQRHRQQQGLIRAFLEEASQKKTFRIAWSEQADYARRLMTELVLSRPGEYGSPDPAAAIRLGLETGFALMAFRILMHEIDKPRTDILLNEWLSVMMRHLDIKFTQCEP
jgi:AcrR family transcriptional regulator